MRHSKYVIRYNVMKNIPVVSGININRHPSTTTTTIITAMNIIKINITDGIHYSSILSLLQLLYYQ